jgi:hypothetical protein
MWMCLETLVLRNLLEQELEIYSEAQAVCDLCSLALGAAWARQGKYQGVQEVILTHFG